MPRLRSADETWPICRRAGPAGERRLQRDVAVLLGRVAVALGLERPERGNQPGARLPRHDDFVDEAALRRDVRIREFLAILGDPGGARRGGVRRRVDLAFVEDVDG